jgi:hypothetical protein
MCCFDPVGMHKDWDVALKIENTAECAPDSTLKTKTSSYE